MKPIALFLAEKLEDLPGDANGTLYYNSAQELRIQADALQRLTVERDALRAALHSISLASQNSGSTKEDMGLYARAAIAGAGK